MNIHPRPEVWYSVQCVNRTCVAQEPILAWGPKDFDHFYCAKCGEEMHVSYVQHAEGGTLCRTKKGKAITRQGPLFEGELWSRT